MEAPSTGIRGTVMAAVFARTPLALALAASVAFGIPASAAEAPTGTLARNVIQNICVRCHDPSASLKTVPPRQSGVAPPFLTVAADPKIDRAHLVKFLKFPHGDMDTVQLTRREIDGLADFILALRAK
jgi:mono/diheme cytochrome c family protein